ncbi:aminotransferase class V-fold PLP-dependent enzyme [Amycolatopsis speibonae]|uniref:Aminotransferase class V-fold PLP-dependent enzyme n=1 Tax=Amycolatopsis speibonae TaxID=1450224 RepID=A0ABV7P2N1_9PSEU
MAFLSLRKRFGVEVVHAPEVPEGGVDVEAMAALMRTRRPKLVTATHIPTNSGLVQPVAEIGRHCRELGLLYLVDACQSVGQYPVDVEQIGADLLTSTCRKFLRGTRGISFPLRRMGIPLRHGARLRRRREVTPRRSAWRRSHGAPPCSRRGCATDWPPSRASRYSTGVRSWARW